MRIRSSTLRREPEILRPEPEPHRPEPAGPGNGPPPAMAHGDMAERMRELRATLLGRRDGAAGRPMTLVVADADRRQAPNRLAADLAIASARLGYQVLLVDANIAHPELHTLFRVPNDHGVSDMAGWATSGAVEVHATAVAGLSLLTAGPPVADAAEAIERLGLCDRLRRFGTRYDTVLIDVTAQPDTEAAAAAAGSDGAILAVRRDRTPIAAIRRTVAAFADRQVVALGLVPVA